MTNKEAFEIIYTLAEQGAIQDNEIDCEELEIESRRQEKALQIYHESCNATFDDFLDSHKL